MPLTLARSARSWLPLSLGALGLLMLAASSFGDFYILANNENISDQSWRILRFLNRLDLAERYETGLFLLCAGLLWGICRRLRPGDPMGHYWWTLNGVFSVILLIKVFPIYTRLVQGLRHFDAVEGRNFSSLVLFAFSLGLALGLGIYFLRFLAGLRPRLRLPFIIGGMLFLAGEIALEGATELFWGAYGGDSLPYVVTDLFERGAETIGLLIFMNGLLMHWGEMAGSDAGWS